MGGILWRRGAPIRPAISNGCSANSTWQLPEQSPPRVGRIVLWIFAQQVGDPGPLNCAPESLQSLFPHRFGLQLAPPCSSSITLAITSSVVSSMTSTSICAVATSSFTLGRGRSLACMSGSRIPSLRRRVESKSPRTRHRSVKPSSRRPRHRERRVENDPGIPTQMETDCRDRLHTRRILSKSRQSEAKSVGNRSSSGQPARFPDRMAKDVA